MRGTFRAATALICVGFLATTPSVAQIDVENRGLYEERPRREGNRIAFCIRPVGPLARFETEVAEKIGQMLLTQVRTFTPNLRGFPVRPTAYDYILGMTDEQMFIMMAEQCDVVMGMHLTSFVPEWLRISRPYLTSEIIAVSRDPGVRTLDDLDATKSIGTQSNAAGDAALVSHFKTLPADKVPQRVTFRTNEALVTALAEGSIDAALIWEGAALAGMDEHQQQFHRLDQLPFPITEVMVGGAVRTPDTFLGALIDEAIAALEANGTLRALAERHNLVWRDEK
ncbi:transporter substrate-binding domain-containing protein [Devosia sp. MC532]|uniref:substrate-binding periplasmic protein n=1 Tax=Devosia sp. MC532 TaxID=2799788 RepID=UPI0018F2EDEA|nr:transporter substrate-binding domain-containing protein [Devosia sp. MC532]MBJ7576782.1 transporter substrate-binding domain-containing protein [Devosia sp. MC532]